MESGIYANILNYKLCYMGLAICLIMWFHMEFDSSLIWMTFPKKISDVGVDIFMFLSGFSLANSFTKHPTLFPFYKKRLIRILPAYFAIFAPFYFYKDILSHKDIWGEFFYNLFFLNYFIDGELIIWFIPVIICYYLLLPFYVMGVKCNSYLSFIPYFLIVTLAVLIILHIDIPTGFLLVRLPVFLLGANAFLLPNQSIVPSKRWISGFIVLIMIGICYYVLEVNTSLWGIKYLCYILLCIILFKFPPSFLMSIKSISWLGIFTLEIYLIHERVMWIFHKFLLNQYILCLVSILVTITLAYLLHQVVGLLNLKNKTD